MPKLISTRTRTSQLGKPEIISIGEGSSRQEVMKHRKIFGEKVVFSIRLSFQPPSFNHLNSIVQVNRNLGS